MSLTLKTTIHYPIFTPPLPPSHHHRPPTIIRFSRWHNPRHDQPQPTQKQTEDKLRFNKRFESANNITNFRPPTTTVPPPYKSTGTPSTPSKPSIPGKKSKYSKPTNNNQHQHPAFKRIVKIRKIPDENNIQENDNENEKSIVKVTESGLTYMIPEAPFEFQYSYTETPKIKPLRLREPAIAPFGPGTMPRPWTGKKPLPPSKKKLDFDSFVLPPPHKKGVKPVQAPGPFLPGSGPKYVKSREEVLGEELSKEEVDDLIKGCLKSTRQLNIGRDGLTHNMLDNIHAHWKRKRVCKIKCKGVCTVDMDNVRHQLEEKTGGKIIYSKGGVVYLFRGRNYNYKTRPKFPLMLWKPITPVYPRLIQRAPEGLTQEEAREMRTKGRQLIPIRKLGKNGVYCEVVNHVREAFEACELVRINCEGMNGSDYRRIGAKLKDLVPCVLVSFELEHILMWRGRDWKSMFAYGNKPHKATNFPDTDDTDPVVTSPESSSSEYSTEDESEENDIILSTPANIEDNNIATSDDNEDITTSEKKGDQDCLVGVMSLLKQAVQDGIAVVLEDSFMDADMAYAKAVAFAQNAAPGPTFRLNRLKKVAFSTTTQKQEKAEETVVGQEVIVTVSAERKQGEKRSPRTTRKKDKKENYLDIVPQPTLRVDELAKLLG